jgi:hypothetical protein
MGSLVTTSEFLMLSELKDILMIIGMATSSRTSKLERADGYSSPANWSGPLLIHDALLYYMQIKQPLHIYSDQTDLL